MEDFEAAIHVSDVVAPAGVTILTDGAEPLARIQAPRQAVRGSAGRGFTNTG